MATVFHRKPLCPKCWESMTIDPCRDGFVCDKPHGTTGQVFLGMEDVYADKDMLRWLTKEKM